MFIARYWFLLQSSISFRCSMDSFWILVRVLLCSGFLSFYSLFQFFLMWNGLSFSRNIYVCLCHRQAYKKEGEYNPKTIKQSKAQHNSARMRRTWLTTTDHHPHSYNNTVDQPLSTQTGSSIHFIAHSRSPPHQFTTVLLQTVTQT